MRRKRNALDSVTIQITTTPQLAKAIERLVGTGLYGANRATAAERLLSEQIRLAMKEGIIQKAAKALEE